MESISFSEELRRYCIILWHWAWILAFATFLASATAYLTSRQITPVYQASTLVLVNEAPSTRAMDYNSLMANERLARTYVETMTTRPVLERVAARLDIAVDLEEFKDVIDAQPVRDTQLIRVTVEDTDPARAAQIANLLVEEFARQNEAEQASRFTASKASLEAQLGQLDAQIQAASDSLATLEDTPANRSERDRLETALSQYRQTYASLLQSYEQVRLTEAQSTATFIQKEPAVPPETPVRPRTLVNTALAAMVGLFTAVGVVFLIEALDDTLKDPDEITRQFGIPVLGLIAEHKNQDDQLITLLQPRSPISEAYRALRTNLQFSSVDRPLRRLLITSPSPSDGKSTVAANLATVTAQSGRETILVDTDLRRPALHRLLKLSNRYGLSGLFFQVLSKDGYIETNGGLQRTGVEHLQVVTSGNLPPNPAELLSSGKLLTILESLERQSDLLILDSPPVLAVTDASVLAPRVDGVLVVVKPGETKMGAIRQTLEQLQQVGARVLGVVLNEVEIKRSSYYGYYYRCYYATYQYGSYGVQSNTNGQRPNPKQRARIRS